MESILKKAVGEYVSQFGLVELRHNLGTSFFICELNQIPTLIFPTHVNYGEIGVIDNLDYFKEKFKNSHKIIRLDVVLAENNSIEIINEVIVCDWVSARYLN
jgi:hypothetical protein